MKLVEILQQDVKRDTPPKESTAPGSKANEKGKAKKECFMMKTTLQIVSKVNPGFNVISARNLIINRMSSCLWNCGECVIKV